MQHRSPAERDDGLLASASAHGLALERRGSAPRPARSKISAIGPCARDDARCRCRRTGRRAAAATPPPDARLARAHRPDRGRSAQRASRHAVRHDRPSSLACSRCGAPRGSPRGTPRGCGGSRATLSPPNFSSTTSASTSATIASATTPAAGTAQTSERWWWAGAVSPVATSTVRSACGIGRDRLHARRGRAARCPWTCRPRCRRRGRSTRAMPSSAGEELVVRLRSRGAWW